MKMRRTTVGMVAAGVAGAALVVPVLSDALDWTPVTSGLDTAPAAMLPATVDVVRPVTVVATSLDATGRPVVRSAKATDRATAVRLVKAGQDAPDAVSVELDVPVYALGVPTGDDPSRAAQWDLARVRTTQAWTTSTGTGTVVAVLDSGVEASHPDLAGQVLPGLDLIGGSGAGTDPHGHGTHVAGTIAAVTGNGIGISGFAPDTRILPVRVLGANGSGDMSAVATGITWATDNGANVINMSLGATKRLTAVTNAIKYARSKGVVVVAAAGNSRASGSPISYPAAEPGVIGVAATDSADKFASYSNRGSYVDVSAPGSDILSTVPGGGYASKFGTSMAAPHVAALAAMIDAARPGLTPDQVEKAIVSSSIDLGAKGKDNDYGYGRIDAPAALAAALNTKVTPTKTPAPAPTHVTVTVQGEAQEGEVAYGSKITASFTLTTADGAAYARKSVQSCVAENNAATFRCSGVTTSATGVVKVTRTATGPVTLKLVVPASKTAVGAESPAYTWSVRATAVLAKSGKTSLSARLGMRPGAVVELQRAEGDAWVTVSSVKAGAGTRSFAKVPLGAVYRVVVGDTALVSGTTSNSVQM